MSLLSPKATRDGNLIKKRLQNEAQKALDKYKLTEEQLEAEKLKLLSKTIKEESSDPDDKEILESRGLYFVDLQTVDATNGDESDSVYSINSIYFKNNIFNKFYKRFISTDKQLKLSWKEFICFVFLLQVPLGFINRHIQLVHTWGAMVVLMVYITLGVIISIPVYMVYMFLGNYTRRGYIRYWDCVPLFKGLAYTIAMSSLYIEIFNVSITSIALYYLSVMFSSSIPWTTCNFPRSTPECVPRGAKQSHTKHCCNWFREKECSDYAINVNLSKYAAFEYYNNHVMRMGYGKTPLENRYLIALIINAEIIWCTIFILLILGLRRYARIFSTINIIVFASLIPVAIFTFIVSPGYAVINSVKTNFTVLKDYTFWIQTSVHILHRELPADVLTFSAASKPCISNTVDTVMIYTMKLFFITTFTVWMSLAINFLQKKYNISDNKCLKSTGDALFFAVFPDVLSELPAPQLWLIWYFSVIVIWGLSVTVYIYNSFLEALCEEFPVLNKWRVFIAAGLCLIAGTGNVFVLDPRLFHHYGTLIGNTIVSQKATMLLLSLVGLFLYSINRVKNDYHFYSGTILGNYWLFGLKVAMLMIPLSTLGWAVHSVTGNRRNELVFAIIISPTVIGVVVSSMRYSLRISKTLISPNARWGPPNRRQKLARIRFDPTHDLRYRSITHSCNHNCLLHSSALKKEMKYWLNRRQQCVQQADYLLDGEETRKIMNY